MVHSCPKCHQKGFTWFEDPDISPNTIWRCYKCEYQVTEVNKPMVFCEICKDKPIIWLQESEGSWYEWCHRCNIYRVIHIV